MDGKLAFNCAMYYVPGNVLLNKSKSQQIHKVGAINAISQIRKPRLSKLRYFSSTPYGIRDRRGD